MATLEKQLQMCSLSSTCKEDLQNHVLEIEANTTRLEKKAVTLPDPNLPSAVTLPTDNSVKRGASIAVATASFSQTRSLHYTSTKEQKGDLLASRSTYNATLSGTHFKDCSHKFVDGPRHRPDPFQASRSRAELSGRDKDFVYRYAEAMTGSAVARPHPSDDATAAATEAYTAAFRRYKGREPTAKELEEVDRLTFSFDENGAVGVVQKPHSCYPHAHISGCKTHVRTCPNQLYRAEVPAVLAARSEFPGPIPTWTSTKRTTTMATNGTYQSGHQRPTSLKHDAVDTIVGSR